MHEQYNREFSLNLSLNKDFRQAEIESRLLYMNLNLHLNLNFLVKVQ
jgi:hypothetical protein